MSTESWIADESLRADGQASKGSDGRTPVPALRRLHVDVHRLDYMRLGNAAQHIVIGRERDRHLRLTERQVTSLLTAAVKRGDVDLAGLSFNLQEEGDEALRTNSG